VTDVVKAAAFWDREIVEQTHVSWMDEPRVQAYIQESIGGSQADFFLRYLNGRTFARGLSIGCGAGNLERAAIALGVCARIDAFDGSVHSLRLAQRAAIDAGYADRIRYFASDFNRPVLPRDTYDIVFFNQSLHHVAELEVLFEALVQAMTRDAVLYLDEYIGPSRTQWSDAVIAPHRAVFASLPADVRKSGFLPLPIQADDPSEAIRSGEIVEQLRARFTIEEFRGYGGNLLAVLWPLIDWSRAPHDLVPRLIEQDRAMAREDGPYYALIVARPGSDE
jgi:SAM-dependent methyltransferase